MSQVKHTLLILAFIIGTSIALTSCGGEDGPDIIVLNGLWEITEIEILTVEEETTDEATEEDTTGGDTSEGEGNAGAGSPPAKTEGENGDGTTDAEDADTIEHLGYMRFGMNTYEYFMVENEKVTTVHSGTYQLSDKTLSLTNEASSEINVALIELNGQQLTMNMTIDGEPQIWYAQKLADDPFPDNDQVALIDFENEVHSADSVPGSLLNPDLMILNETLSDTLEYVEPYKAERFFYLKVDTAKTYQLTVQIIDPQYDLPAAIMEYVQVWLSYQPFANNYKAEDNRIEPDESEALFEDIKSPTGYLYIRLFSYQNKIHYKLTLEEQVQQE